MIKSRYDIPLKRDETSRFLPWIIAVMVYLAALALASAVALSDIAQRWRGELSGSATVEVAALVDGDPRPPEERAVLAIEALDGAAGIRSVTVLSPEAALELLEPWLGPLAQSPELAADLPLPVLLDVELDPDVPADAEELQVRLDAVGAGAVYSDHAAWLGDVLRLTRLLQFVALAVVALIGAVAVLSVVFAARAAFAIHQPVVELLHTMGATDRYIARQFQDHAMNTAMQGGAVGLAAAALTLLAVDMTAARGEIGLMPDLSLSGPMLAVLLFVPAAATLLAVVTARLTVTRALSAMP